MKNKFYKYEYTYLYHKIYLALKTMEPYIIGVKTGKRVEEQFKLTLRLADIVR